MGNSSVIISKENFYNTKLDLNKEQELMMEFPKIQNIKSKLLELDSSLQEVMFWAFTLMIISHFISFTTSSHNLAIIGICLALNVFIVLIALYPMQDGQGN